MKTIVNSLMVLWIVITLFIPRQNGVGYNTRTFDLEELNKSGKLTEYKIQDGAIIISQVEGMKINTITFSGQYLVE